MSEKRRTWRRCRVGQCCARPAPMAFVVLEHARVEDVSEVDGEVWWWLECWSCGYVCTCEV